MNTAIRLHPTLRYRATLCGTRGDHLILPGQAVLDLSAPGDASEAATWWAPEIDRPESLTPERLALILKETGGWSEEELADDGKNWERAILVAAGVCAEEAREGIVDICEPETSYEAQALVEAFLWTGDGQDLVDEVCQLVLNRVGEGLSDEEFEKLFKTGAMAHPTEVRAKLGETPVAAEFDRWVKRRIDDLVSSYTARTHEEFFLIEGSHIRPYPDDIADWIDLAHKGLKPIVQEAAQEAYKARRKQDIRRLCKYMGVPFSVEARAVELDLDRVPKILELAGR